uniref:Uncharacterized protein n=1 Tax=Streptococcus thermophilus TaxID=1308 RepID=O30929_STRTR|nr:unknown protein [Streptococcus thermophilus]
MKPLKTKNNHSRLFVCIGLKHQTQISFCSLEHTVERNQLATFHCKIKRIEYCLVFRHFKVFGRIFCDFQDCFLLLEPFNLANIQLCNLVGAVRINSCFSRHITP